MDYHNNVNLSDFSNELKLLLNILKIDSDEEQFIVDNESLFSTIDWEHFLQLAKHHRVYPSIYKKLNGAIKAHFPAHVIQALTQLYQKNTFQMLYLSGEMDRFCILFAENGIRALLLKGPVLACELYGDISLRTSSDLDILVQIGDLDKVDELLKNYGYIKDEYIQSVLGDWKWRHHHVTYYNAQKKIKMEIHWKLHPGPVKEPKFMELWERKRISSLTSTPVFFLGKEDLFLFLISHGARHGWSRLRWLLDIEQIVKQKNDWNALAFLLRKYHYRYVGGQALLLISQLLNVSLSKEMTPITASKRSERLAKDALFYIKRMVNLHMEPLPEEIANYHKYHLFKLMSKSQKFIFILSFLYPYPKDVETLPLPKMLHFLYFPLRPFLLAWRKTRRQVP